MAKAKDPRNVIDWDNPVLTFEETREFMGYADDTMKDWCRAHRDLCQPVNGGRFGIHRDGFIAWFASGRGEG